MASKTYQPGMEGELGRDLKQHYRRLMVAFHREMHAEARRKAESMTDNISVTGTISSRWGDRISGRDFIPSIGSKTNQHRIKVGTKSAVINDDAGAAAIDHARVFDYDERAEPYTRKSGLPARGISKPTKRHLLGYAPRAAAKATAKTEARFGR